MKEKFLEYIKNDIRYNKSYKLVLYKAFFELAIDGKAEEDKIVDYFRDFYLNRKQQGLKVEDNDATDLILNIDSTSFNRIKGHIKRMPLERMDYLESENGFIKMDNALWNELSENNIEEVKQYLDEKLTDYYQQKLGADMPNNEKFMFQKKVNWSVFKWGFTVPIEHHSKFYATNDEKLESGEAREIKFFIDNREFSVSLRNVDRNTANDTFQIRYDNNEELKQLLRDEFNFSYQYIIQERERQIKEEGKKRPQVNVPEDNAEYIGIYSTKISDEYKVRLFKKGDLKKVLQSNFIRIMNEYYDARKSEQFAGHELGDLFRHELPNILEEYINNFRISEDNNYIIKGSIGQGNWARVPWIAIMDEEVTTTTRKGVYVVYLFSDDMSSLYLTLNQGVTNTSTEEQIKTKNKLREQLDLSGFNIDNDLNLTERGIGQDYEESTVAYIEYKKNNLPNEEVLLNDLKEVLKIYNEYKNRNIIVSREDEGAKIIKETEGLAAPAPPEAVEQIKDYIEAKGFIYPDGLIENFYLSLKTKPFVLLAGISGTGKTKLIQLFAEAINCTEDNGRFKLISVRSDWSDGSDLLGYNDLKGNFKSGPMIDIIKQAIADRDNIYMVCLDEMNLARVEYYFSDLLSVMETRKKVGDKIKSKVLLEDEYFTKEEDKEKYGGLYLPDNLYIVGTVNMDETTHPFSKKVLDRANTIEFSKIDLDSFNLAQDEKEVIRGLTNDFLRPEYVNLNDCEEDNNDFIQKVVSRLKEINEILKLGNLQVGYRVRDEISFYMLYNKDYSLLEFDTAFDFQLMQKILPRIQGSSRVIKEILMKLFAVAAGKDYSITEGRIGDRAVEYVDNDDNELKYPNSAQKLAYMIKRFEEDGFTSYWL